MVLVGCHVIDQVVCCVDSSVHESTAGGCVNGDACVVSQAVIEGLHDEPLFQAMVRADSQKFFESVPCLTQGFSISLPEIGDLVAQVRGFAWRKVLGEEGFGKLLPCCD